MSHPDIFKILQPTAEESAALNRYARSQIREFLKLLDTQKRAEEQGLPKSERRKAVSAYNLPLRYDPHTTLPVAATAKRTHLGFTRPPRWDAQRSLLVENKEKSHQTLCSNVSLINFGIGPLAQDEAGDWTQYWRAFEEACSVIEDSRRAAYDGSPELYPFALLQDFCTQAELMECSSERCQAMRRRLNLIIPPCNVWSNFREWILVAESCQLSMVANKFHWIYEFTLEFAIFMLEDFWDTVQKPDLENLAFDILEIFWFHSSQVQPILQIREEDFLDSHGKLATGVTYPSPESNFDQKLYYKASQKALAAPIALKICRKRIWDLASMAQRKHGDIPAILEIVESSSSPSIFAHRGHEDCTPEFCEFADENSTIKKQLHKCPKQSCRSIKFPVGKLAKVIQDGRKIAWKVVKRPGWHMSPALIDDGGLDEDRNATASETLAISHVWSDGTGVGVKSPGMVNKCLVEFFFALAKSLGCSGLWWDTICVPTAKNDEEKKARSVAISKMHQNYANAKHTLIHDEYLLKINWAEDGSPAIALVLSPWFSRGWTALELSVSNSVKILYRDPQNPRAYVIKDLDDDILVRPPFGRLGHVVASALIRKLRGRPSTLMDLLTILSTRSTSWNRDRMAIAGLFARISDFDYNSSRGEATRQILEEYHTFDRSLLHHGQATIVDQGPFSWCPSNILLGSQELLTHWNPVVSDPSAQVQLCPDPHEYGSVLGAWYYTVLNEDTIHEVKPLAKHLNVYKMLDEVLPECLVILHSEAAQLPALLVVATGMWSQKQGETCYVDCHYAGCVRTELSDDRNLCISERRWSHVKHHFKLGTSTWKKPRPARLFIDNAKSIENFTIDYEYEEI